MNSFRIPTLVGTGLMLVLAACQGASSDILDPSLRGGGSADGTGSSQNLGARVRCEVRAGKRSKVSVDGNNLRPLGGVFTARITSGANTALSAPRTAYGDEVEFDFDSDADDIRAGATAISPGFIVGGSVSAVILGADNQVVASGTAACRMR